MSEILLQTIVEKLESLEIALLKESDAGKDESGTTQSTIALESVQSELMKISSFFDGNNKKVNNLTQEIRSLRLKVNNPTQNQIRPIHHFHKQVWLSVNLFIISLLLAYGWINCSNEKKFSEANDMKYRFWKANGNTSLLKIVYFTDSLYNLDKEHFIQQVIGAEQQISE